MNSALRFLIFAAIFFDVALAAAKVELYSWQARPTLPPMVIVVPEGQSPAQAARKYIETLRVHPELSTLFQTPDLYGFEYSDFKKLPQEIKSRALLVANRASDYVSQTGRIEKFRTRYESLGNEVFLLPISADVNLTEAQILSYHQAVIDHFTILSPMGGDDANPDEYNEINVASQNVNATRDRSEVRLIRAFNNAARGFIFAICRGAQITAAAVGYKINQHVDHHLQNGADNPFVEHSVDLLETPSGILAEIAAGIRRIFVNSYHHQAILMPSPLQLEQGPLVPAALAPDGTLEAMEMKNRRGLLLQWHPEFMNDVFSDGIFETIVKIAKRDRIDACHARFGGGGSAPHRPGAW